MDYGAFREIVEHARRTPEAIGLVVKAWSRLPEPLQASALDLARCRLDVLLVWDDLLTLGDAVEWCVLAMGGEVSEDQAVSVAWWLGLQPQKPSRINSIGLGGPLLMFADKDLLTAGGSQRGWRCMGVGDALSESILCSQLTKQECPYLTDECLAPWLQMSA